MAKTSVKILIVDDHALVREGLVRVLEEDAQYKVCAQAANTGEALAAVERETPDLMVVDLMLGGEDGLELLKSAKSRWPDMPVLVISARDETLYAERALRAGAAGFLMKSAPPGDILNAVNMALHGEIALSRKQNSRLLGLQVKGSGAEDDDVVSCLSDRQLHIFQLIGVGQSMREIAGRLGISVRTAETHRDNIKTKLGLDSALAVTRHAVNWVEQNGV